MRREFRLLPGEVAFLSDGRYTVGAVRAHRARHVFIETDTEELVRFLEKDDLIAVSAFSQGEKAREGIMCMLYLIRECRMPLLVLSKTHPATRRLPMVASAGDSIRLTSCIIPGTHPEQDVLCGRGGLDGVRLSGADGKIEIDAPDDSVSVEIWPWPYAIK